MTIEKRKPKKNEAAKKAPKFQSGSIENQTEHFDLNALTEGLRKSITKQVKHEQALEKTVKAQNIKKDMDKKYDKTKVVFSTREYSQEIDGVELKGWRRIKDAELKELSQIDPYVSAIITNRCAQAAVIGYPSDSKFDKGTRILDLQAPDADDFETDEAYKNECKLHEAHQKAILKWILNCGTSDQEVINTMFQGGDLTFKNCTLREFLEAQVRNLLTFGRCATQILRNEDGVPVAFRPVPVETINNVTNGSNIFIGSSEDAAEQSYEDLDQYNEIEPDERPYAYVQRIDGRNVNFFTEDDLHVWHWQRQALFDLNGYPLAPIEQAIYMVYVHTQTLNYLRNQFVKGLAAKGLISMEATQAGVEISEADLEGFRQEFHNFASRNDNSAAVPVIGGPIKVQYIPMSSTPRDMEFLQVEEHVIRALCSAFQISPQEMGYGNLGLPQGGITQTNKQEDIIKGEERGLRMLLDIIYDGINRIIYLNFPEAQEKYRATYVGVGEDTRDTVIQRQQMEMQTTATMNSLLSDSEKTDMAPVGGDVPLSPTFHQSVVRYMKYGDLMEHYFKEEGASKKPEYDFIIDPNLNAAYQQLKVQPIQMQQAQAAQAAEGAQLQLEAQEQQMQAGGAAAMGMGQPDASQQDPNAAVAQQGQSGADQPTNEQGGAPVEKSMTLRDKYREAQALRKSVKAYLGAWQDLHR